MMEIYTRENCPICHQTKELLNSNFVDYVEYQIDRDIMRSEVLAKFPGVSKVPIIVNGGKVGGYSDLQLLMEKEHG